MRVIFGKKYRDKIHGVEGIATCHSKHMNGCDRVCLEYMQSGKVEEYWVDITQIEPVKTVKKVLKKKTEKKRGGFQSDPPRRTV